MFSSWIVDSGVSRGQTTSLRSSFNATEAARWMRFCIAPDAIVPSVPIEHGQMTYASTLADPDAYGAFQSFGSYTVTFAAARSVKRASVSSRERRASSKSSVASTSIAAPETETPTSTSAADNACSKRCAYGAPDAPVMPRNTRTPKDYVGVATWGPWRLPGSARAGGDAACRARRTTASASPGSRLPGSGGGGPGSRDP